uniref:Uncharacterized protein n=1 Tax=Romanomermis culicivorax TaxID=13658 RepID=A0A915ICY8_ROMCU
MAEKIRQKKKSLAPKRPFPGLLECSSNRIEAKEIGSCAFKYTLWVQKLESCITCRRPKTWKIESAAYKTLPVSQETTKRKPFAA